MRQTRYPKIYERLGIYWEKYKVIKKKNKIYKTKTCKVKLLYELDFLTLLVGNSYNLCDQVFFDIYRTEKRQRAGTKCLITRCLWILRFSLPAVLYAR